MENKLTLFVLLFVPILIFSQMQNPKNIPFDWKTDTTKYSIDKSEIQIVMAKGSFPRLDFPNFFDKVAGLKAYFAKEPVIAVEINGKAKAYPLNVLTFYEISNDSLGGVPILATYCPLCNSGLVFNRKIKHKNKEYLLDFNVSGMLRKSDMIMLDRNTETLWQQIMGVGIVGEMNEVQLEIIPSMIISVEEFFMHYPNGKILSNKTDSDSMQKQLGKNPYKKYDDLGSKPYGRFFKEEDIDKRLPAMERIVAIENEGSYKVYTFSTIRKHKVINDTFQSKNVVLFYQKGAVSVLDEGEISKSKDIGSVTVFSSDINAETLIFNRVKGHFEDTKTDSFWDSTGYCYQGKLRCLQLKIEPHSNQFAFAWFAFYPETEVYK